MADDLELILLGTGTSSGLPAIGCLTSEKKGCLCCRSTLTDDPEARKNVRRNTGGVLRIPSQEPGGRTKTLLIDVRSAEGRRRRARLSMGGRDHELTPVLLLLTVRQDVLRLSSRVVA